MTNKAEAVDWRADYEREKAVKNAESYVLPALIICGLPANMAMKMTDELCKADPEAAIKVSGHLLRGEEVPPEIITRLKGASYG